MGFSRGGRGGSFDSRRNSRNFEEGPPDTVIGILFLLSFVRSW